MKQEKTNTKLGAKNIALIAVFAPSYTIFTFWSLFPVIGAPGKFITMAVIMAPLIGIILGPYLGVLSVAVGGIVGLSVGQIGGPFGPLSFVPHAAATFCSGMLYNGKRMTCAITYAILLVVLAFYPVVGPVWLYPYFIWMQIFGLVILVSPLQSKAVKQIYEHTKLTGLTFGVGIVSLTATLFGHIVGDIMFEAIYWPNLISSVDAWKSTWQLLAWVYPIERVTITIVAALIGIVLIKALKAYGLKL
ncbi:MAG: hypothetical protein OEX16_06060 [Hadesarchaea archaeon]|nr:hypothetical protein [Hadesarchaea archaeon]MDH5686209.1 hypothetical protein [Hadesarchaea archaeon]